MEKILLVDDDQLFLNSMKHVLSKDYDVETVDEGSKALEKLQEGNYALVISDYNMPDITGLELLKRIRELKHNLPVILITGFGTFEIAVEALHQDVCTILSKPVRMKDLREAVKKALKAKILADKQDVLEVQKMELEQLRHLLRIGWNRFRVVFDNITDPMIIFDKNLRVIDANQTAWDNLEIDKGEPLEKQPWYSVFDNYYCAEVCDFPAKDALTKAQPAHAKVFDGTNKKLYQIDAYPVFDENSTGKIVSIVEFHKDITESTQKEAHMVDIEKLNNQNKIFAEVGHEINNMITPLSMISQMAIMLLQRQDYSTIEKNLGKMNTQLEKIATFARRLMENHAEENQIRKIELIPFINALLGYLQPQPIYSNIKFERRWKNSDIIVNFDEIQLQQILVNLIKNAAEAIKSGTITISVRSTENDKVEIKVSDDGPGIPPEVLDKLFQHHITTKESGHGYGLIIVQKLVKQNGGTIDVSSILDQGTEFIMEFPGVK